MKKIIYIISLSILSLTISAQTKEKYFKIEVKQDGELRKLKEDTYKLRKKPFELIVYFKKSKKSNCIQLRVDSTSIFFDIIGRKKVSIEQLNCFQKGCGLAEYPQNIKKNLMLDNSEFSHHYWCFDSKAEESRFREIEKYKKWLKGFYSVENLFFLDSKKTIKIEEFGANTLYFAILTEKMTKKNKSKILQKKRFKIEFIK